MTRDPHRTVIVNGRRVNAQSVRIAIDGVPYTPYDPGQVLSYVPAPPPRAFLGPATEHELDLAAKRAARRLLRKSRQARTQAEVEARALRAFLGLPPDDTKGPKTP